MKRVRFCFEVDEADAENIICAMNHRIGDTLAMKIGATPEVQEWCDRQVIYWEGLIERMAAGTTTVDGKGDES